MAWGTGSCRRLLGELYFQVRMGFGVWIHSRLLVLKVLENRAGRPKCTAGGNTFWRATGLGLLTFGPT